MRGPAALLSTASGSRGVERDVEEFSRRLAMFEAFCDDAEGEGLNAGHGIIAVAAVAQDARQGGHLGQPAPVLFALEFDGERHAPNVPFGQQPNKRLHPTAAAGRFVDDRDDRRRPLRVSRKR
jgi:hypothetical protein